MHALTLISTTERPLKPMIEAAVANELRLLKAAIRRSEQRLLAFETNYGMPAGEFLRRFESDELQESLDFAEWIGEHRLLERLREKTATLQGIQFAN